MVNEVCLAQLETRENQGFKGYLAFRDRRETVDTRGIQARKVLRVLEEWREMMDHLV